MAGDAEVAGVAEDGEGVRAEAEGGELGDERREKVLEPLRVAQLAHYVSVTPNRTEK